MSKNSLAIMLVVAVVIGALGGFYGGIQYQQNHRGNLPGGAAQGFPNGLPSGTNRQGGTGKQGSTGIRPVSGEITNLDASTITVKTQDGSSKIVIYSASSKVNKTSEGSVSDLKVGEQATVLGSENSDGTVTAQSISIGNGTVQGIQGGDLPGQNE